jgi:hypothetical protein
MALVRKHKSRGVLDTRFRGYDGLEWRVIWVSRKDRLPYFFLLRLAAAFGSGVSACGSKPI